MMTVTIEITEGGFKATTNIGGKECQTETIYVDGLFEGGLDNAEKLLEGNLGPIGSAIARAPGFKEEVLG